MSLGRSLPSGSTAGRIFTDFGPTQAEDDGRHGVLGLTERRLSNRPQGNRLNHGVGFWSDDSDTLFLAVALAVLGLLELSLALGLG